MRQALQSEAVAQAEALHDRLVLLDLPPALTTDDAVHLGGRDARRVPGDARFACRRRLPPLHQRRGPARRYRAAAAHDRAGAATSPG